MKCNKNVAINIKNKALNKSNDTLFSLQYENTPIVENANDNINITLLSSYIGPSNKLLNDIYSNF